MSEPPGLLEVTRARLKRGTRLVVLSWLPFGTMATAAECIVKEFFAEAVQSVQPVVVAPSRVTDISAPRGAILGSARPIGRERDGAPDPPPDAAELRKREVRAAINKRDLDALTRALPADDAARRELLRQSYAIDSAFRASALPVARQILKWDPSAISNRTPISNSQALQGVARNWQNVERMTREGIAVENAPSAQDEVELIRILLSAGADPDGQGDWLTPLGILASMTASLETTQAAEMLLQRGATLEKIASNGKSALSMAAERQNAELVRMMMESRQPSQDALDEAIVKSPFVESNGAIPLLLEHGANINADGSKYGVGQIGFRPAWTASGRVKYHGERELMRLLIRYKADPNAVVNNTNSPLMWVMHDHELMKGLLDLGANPNYRNYAGDMPLHLAIRLPREIRKAPEDNRPLAVIEPGLDPNVRSKSVTLLLQYGADPNGRDGSGTTPLMLTGPDDAEIVDLLIARGGRLNLDEKALAHYHQYQAPVGPVSWSLLRRNDDLAAALVRSDGVIRREDCGALYYAAQTGATKTLIALLDRKANAHAASGLGGMTPLIVAASYGQAAAVKILLDRRAANVNETTPLAVQIGGGHGVPGPALVGGQTALTVAAARGHSAVVEELIKHGASINHVDSAGQTALSYARRAGADKIVALLRTGGARE